MKKYLEQRVEELELEVKLLRAKFKLEETKSNPASQYLNQYPKYDPFKDYKKKEKLVTTREENTPSGNCCSSYAHDYMHTNLSVNLMSEPDLETAFASPFDKTNFKKNPLDTITVSVPTHSDADIKEFSPNEQNVSFEDYPPYPDVVDSWDKNPDDVVDEYGYKLNYKPETVTTWGFVSEFDKMDKDFLKWLSTNEAKRAFTHSQIKTKKKQLRIIK